MKRITLLLIAAAFFSSCSPKIGNILNSLNTSWKYEVSTDANVPAFSKDEPPTIAFDMVNSKVSGMAGCNTFNGTFTIKGDEITFGELASTRKFCLYMNFENYYLNFLKEAGNYKLEGAKMYLYKKGDRSKYISFMKL